MATARLSRRARRVSSPSTTRGCASSEASRPTRSPRTAATSAATPATCAVAATPTPATVSEAMVAGYVEELRSARDDDGRPRVRAVVDRACRGRGAVVPPVLRRGGARALRPERGHRRPPRAAGDPEGAERGRRSRRCSARCRATARARSATGRSSRRSTRAGCASASSSGSSVGDLDLRDGIVRVLGKGSKERVVPLGRTARAALDDYLRRGRPELERPEPPAGKREPGTRCS